jgi:Subtilase family
MGAQTFRRTLSVSLAVVVIGAAGYHVAALGQALPQPVVINDVSPEGRAQISALLAEKAALTATQRKINSRLLHAKRRLTRETSVTSVNVVLPRSANGKVELELRADVTDRLLTALRALGADVVATQATGRSVLVDADLLQVEQIAALPDVYHVQPRPEFMTSRRERKARDRSALIASVRAAFAGQGSVTNIGSVTSQGDVTHKAAAARATFGIDGSGVKVGVLSDGVTHLSTSQATGNLGAVTVLAGQTGSGDEGTAMLEIVHDLAPGAQLFFATALPSTAQFAQNIRDLRTAGCDIIIDDVLYFVETPFQDGQAPSVISPTNGGVIAQAVKDVTAAGALYFASALNSGNKDAGTSGTWEGDFVDGGPTALGRGGRLHNFGTDTFDVVAANTGPVSLHWSDPLGGSANDYDIFVLNSPGTVVEDFSDDVQTGTQDPFELMGFALAGERIVIVKIAGAGRFLHLDTNRGRLATSTAGSTHGHADTSSPTSFSVGATPAADAFTAGFPIGPYPNPFNATNTIELFSSDGPRHIFFTSTGAAMTPGDLSSTGGQILQKPDITAADGVSVSGAGGFPLRFFGTSAAAPHAGAIAALVMAASPGITASEVRTALLNSAIDIHAPGVDRDSGAGIVMADAAIVSRPTISVQPTKTTVAAHASAALSVVALGLPPLSYQWHQGLTGVLNPISGATSSTFVTPPQDVLTPYWVRVSNSAGSVNSNTAVVVVTYTDLHSVTDPTLTTGVTPVRAAHVLELRNRIDTLRSALSLGSYPWTDPALPVHSTMIKPVHVNDLRAAITAVYAAKGLPAPTFTGSIGAGTVIRAQHIGELRNAVTAVEPAALR